MWQRTVPLLIEKLIGAESLPLCIQVAGQPPIYLGDPAEVVLRINSFKGFLSLLFPSMGRFAESYVLGHIDLEGELNQIMVVGERLGNLDNRFIRILGGLPSLPHRTGVAAAEHIQHHYDVSDAFYALWLDRQMVYSGAYFRRPDDSLDRAQAQKLTHICRKLRLQPGDRMLDIGCGWGALLFEAVENYGVTALGITLSDNQYHHVRAEIDRRGLGERCRVELRDFRELPPEPRFNKIASIGMIEHVVEREQDGYFATIQRLLEPGGLMLIQGITLDRFDASLHAGGLSRFVQRYVFPCSELSPVHRVTERIQRSGLESVDVEALGRHYEQTLRLWVERLDRCCKEAIAEVGEERFRIWRIYMGGFGYAFQRGWVNLYQWLGSKRDAQQRSTAPWTRDDIYLD